MADEEGSSSSPGIDGQESSANRNNNETNLRPTTTSEKKTTKTKTKTVAVESPKAKTHKETSSDYSLSERFSILSKPKVRSEFHIRTGYSNKHS